MKVLLDLPQELRVSDYHEFDVIEDILNTFKSNKKIKIKEIGFAGQYLGIAFIGNLNAPENKELKQQLLKEIKEYDKDNY